MLELFCKIWYGFSNEEWINFDRSAHNIYIVIKSHWT